MLYKHIGLVTKRPGDSFVAHWRGTHASLAKQLPGLRKYVINPIDKRISPGSPIDGIAELWFDSEADAAAAWASEAGAETAADGAAFFDDMTVTNPHEIHIV